ncbi:MAG: SMC family ATPase [Anaerolineae bacterium]|nr:SMC family ATPase [Thermoflexales bacterium]MDW8395235.1 SMC family ATPase [Anaerolineae bacterium]
MIPVRLELKNFMAYRSPDPLDFTGLHVVCLVGENGAGKSSILDAITWALWGQARARREDELVHQGESEMRVGFVFREGTQEYMVVRTRRINRATAKGRMPTSSGTLDLFVRGKNQEWVQLSEPRMNETQQKIESILRLSYEAFVNSAYLKQGRADEFTLKPPAQRKALLAEILNLEVWEAYEARAKAQLDRLEAQRERLLFELQRAQTESARLPQHQQALEAAQAALVAAQQAVDQAEAEATELERQRERARNMQTQLAQVADRVRQFQAELTELASQREDRLRRLRESEALLAQRDTIERGFAELERVRAQNEAMNQKLSDVAELGKRKHALENTIADARRALESERDAQRRHLEDLQRLAVEDDLRVKLDRILEQLAELETEVERLEQSQQALAEARERQATLSAQNQTLKQAMHELKARIEALRKVGAICPTCGRELTEADRARLLAEWEAKGRQMGDEYRANEATMRQMAEQRSRLESNLEQLRRRVQAIPGLQRERAALEERLAQARDAAARLPDVRAALSATQALLDAADYAHEARTALKQVEAELAALGYDAAEHARLRQQIVALQPFAEQKAALERAQLVIEAERAALEAIEVKQQQRRSRMESELQEQRKLETALAALNQTLAREREVKQALSDARTRLFAAQRRVVEAEQQVQTCLALRDLCRKLQQELDALAHQQAALQELRLAFSKNGVPAMIIESALPELESFANELLGRMSSGRMSVRFETQRLTQRGETTETLDIRISDELGERAYEMFSGGEAFRINFAIRIALSRLLAHRASASLQTLFIDEGFGTQDAQGRERLIEAIRAIETDFERIFVITHIEELKEAFPSRIEVVRTPQGSMARVV